MREQADFCEEALNDFLCNDFVQTSDMIVFNGDIFDYASGFHPAYWERFQRFFNTLKTLLQASKRIVFVEGNHDIHLEKVFRRFIQTFDGNQENFTYVTSSIVVKANDHHIYFSHGDEIPGSKAEYIKYKNIIRSRAVQIVANLFPLSFFDMLAIKASGDSRKRSNKYNENDTKNFYLKAVKTLKTQYPHVDDFVLGHSHLEESQDFYNTGFSPKTRKFFYFDGESSSLQSF